MMKYILSALLVSALSVPAYAQDEFIQAPPDTNIVIPDAQESTVVAVPSNPDSAMPGDVVAVPSNPRDLVPTTPIEKEISEQIAFMQPNVNIDTLASLFFSVWEHDLVRDARRGLNTRDNTDDGVDIAGPRDISLGGIIFTSRTDWTIWLNNVRVSPTRIPTEVMDLKVFRDYIELEWFDATTNQIFPIRLRPQQRFNLDSRIFLPG